MIKKIIIIAVAAVTTLSMSMTTFAAGSWQKDSTGWWWQRTDETYPANEWKWIDGNNDGMAECYYFDSNGYLLCKSTSFDGYQVNADGAWVADGVIQNRHVDIELGDEVAASDDFVNTVGSITDGTMKRISINNELVDLFCVNGLDKIPDKTVWDQGQLILHFIEANY